MKDIIHDVIVFLVVSACTGAVALHNKAVSCGGQRPQSAVSSRR